MDGGTTDCVVRVFLKGGKSGNDVYFNDPFWMDWNMNNIKPDTYKDFVCVDGLQRLTSIQRFINNEIKVLILIIENMKIQGI